MDAVFPPASSISEPSEPITELDDPGWVVWARSVT